MSVTSPRQQDTPRREEEKDTKSRILDAAERLFAGRGFAGTSIRAITDEAGVNVAAVNYHFGSKRDLLRGVTGRIVEPILRMRLEALDRLEAATGGAPGLEALLEAFVRPDVEVLLGLQARGATVARFVGMTYADRTPWIQQMARDQFEPAGRRFSPAFSAALPQLDADEVALRLRWTVAVIVDLFSTWPAEGLTRSQADRVVGRLVAYLAGGMSAPPGAVEGVVGTH